MRIVRESTFRWINFYDKSTFFTGNGDKSRNNEVSLFKPLLFGKKLVESHYNIKKKFEDNSTVIINTLYDSIVVLNDKETEIFEKEQKIINNNEFLIQLFLLGIFIEEKENEKLLLEMQNKEIIINRRGIPSITILPTQACNARCEYCFAEHNKKITMSTEIVNDLVLFLKRNFKEGDEVLLRWFGGEPLVAVNVIDEIVEKIDRAFNGKLKYKSLMFTNGSLLDDDIIDRANSKWNLKKIQLTIDGYGQEHNNRKGYADKKIDYYEKVIKDVEKLLSVGIKVDCRINLDKDNILQIDNIIEDLIKYKENECFRARFTILRPSDCGYNRFNYIKPNDLKWAYSIIYTKLYDAGFIKSVEELIPVRQKESCIAKSINKVIIGADGKLYKCLQQVFDENNNVGNLKDGISSSEYIKYCNKTLHSGCRECIYLPICSGGCMAYWELMRHEEVTPCIREKYFIDLLLEFVHKWK